MATVPIQGPVVVFVALNILDSVTTIWSTSVGASELNPVFSNQSWWGLMGIKAVLVLTVILILQIWKRKHLYTYLNIAFISICVWNSSVLVHALL